MSNAVIDVGGGIRGAYAAGVLDYCLDHDINFDLCIGISAGAANLASYVANQKGRNYKFYTEYAKRPESMSLSNLKNKHSYIDLDYIYSTLSNEDGEMPLDYDAFERSDKEMVIVATNAITGNPVYFTREDFGRDNYDVFKASCSIPIVCPPYPIKNVPFFDGALADPIPVDKALELGADKIVVILTKPSDEERKGYKDKTLSLLMKDYPKAKEQLKSRIKRYNYIVSKLKEMEKEGTALIVSPESTDGVDTLSKDMEAIDAFYKRGYEDGEKIAEFLQPAVPAEEILTEAS